MLQVMIRVKNAIRKKCVRYLKNMEEEGCSSILQYFFFAHIGYVVEGDCCTQKISCVGLR